MGNIFKKHLLSISVFITGACVLIIEIVAVRVLSPHYGSTIFTVSSVISVILAALSIGYYVGGKFADRHPSLKLFFVIILTSGLVVLAIHFLGIIILPALSVILPLTTGPLFSSMILFLIPALLLGTLSPYAIKLQSAQAPEQGVGSVSGKIFFWSTLGSITGSLLAGFVLIPNFGIDYIFITTGIVLFLLGFIPLLVLRSNKRHPIQVWLIAVIAVILVSIVIFTVENTKVDAVYSKDGIYEKITIQDGTFKGGRPTRYFKQDRSFSGAMFLDTNDPNDFVFEFMRFHSLYKVFKPDIQNALVIGGGVYSIPNALLNELPNAIVDVSEIEPVLFELAKKYFNLKDSPNLNNYVEDGRRLLQKSNKKYDLIFGDAYYSLYSIPSHLTTREFFITVKDKLSPGGLFIANLIGDLSTEKPSFIFSEIKTFQSVFPNSYFFASETTKKQAYRQNILLVGYNSEEIKDLNSISIKQSEDPFIRSLPDKVINISEFDLSSYPVLTDNFSPVEYLTTGLLKRASQKP
jgi:predicted membrane-bound spermidine synthase